MSPLVGCAFLFLFKVLHFEANIEATNGVAFQQHEQHEHEQQQKQEQQQQQQGQRQQQQEEEQQAQQQWQQQEQKHHQSRPTEAVPVSGLRSAC